MDQPPLVSIIVPVYRVAEYLPRCLDSLLAQLHRPLELIVVDDGSPDECPAIIDEYAARYDIIRPIHQANAGVGAARNAGLAAARGEYVGFVDSDDFVEPDYVSRLLRKMLKHGADIAICNFSFDLPNGARVPFPLLTPRRNLSGERAAQYSMDLLTIPTFAWNKLYRRSLWDGIEFPSIYYEDVAMAARVLERADGVAVTHRALYHYCLRGTGITGHFTQKNVRDYLRAAELIRDFLWEQGLWETWARPYRRFLRHVQAQLIISLGLQPRLPLSERRAGLRLLRERIVELRLPPDQETAFDEPVAGTA